MGRGLEGCMSMYAVHCQVESPIVSEMSGGECTHLRCADWGDTVSAAHGNLLPRGKAVAL